MRWYCVDIEFGNALHEFCCFTYSMLGPDSAVLWEYWIQFSMVHTACMVLTFKLHLKRKVAGHLYWSQHNLCRCPIAIKAQAQEDRLLTWILKHWRRRLLQMLLFLDHQMCMILKISCWCLIVLLKLRLNLTKSSKVLCWKAVAAWMQDADSIFHVDNVFSGAQLKSGSKLLLMIKRKHQIKKWKVPMDKKPFQVQILEHSCLKLLLHPKFQDTFFLLFELQLLHRDGL